MDEFEKEYEQFLKDTVTDSKKLKLLLDELAASKYSYFGVKLSGILPVYSNNRVKIYIPEKRGGNNTKLF
jgi:hypothetical protein